MRDSETEKIAAYIMAKGEADRLQNYVNRGRPYEGAHKNRLELLLIRGYRDLAEDFRNWNASQLTSDVAAEYSLRGEQTPYHLVRDEINRFSKAVAAVAMDLGEERLAEIDHEMVEEYEDGTKRRN